MIISNYKEYINSLPYYKIELEDAESNKPLKTGES